MGPGVNSAVAFQARMGYIDPYWRTPEQMYLPVDCVQDRGCISIWGAGVSNGVMTRPRRYPRSYRWCP